MRTRSSRRLEEPAEQEGVPEIAKVSTRRRGRKTAGKPAQTKAVLEQEIDITTQQPYISPSEEVTTVPSTSEPGQAIPPANGHTHQAATFDEAQHDLNNSDAEMDFLAEGTKLAEALLQAPEDGDPASSPAEGDGQPHSSPKIDAGGVGRLALPADGMDQVTGICAASEVPEENGGACPTEMPGSAPSGAAHNDRQPDEQEAVSDDNQKAHESPSTCHLPRVLQPSETFREEVTQPAENPASSQPPAESLKRTTSNALHTRRSMRSGSLDAYERGTVIHQPLMCWSG